MKSKEPSEFIKGLIVWTMFNWIGLIICSAISYFSWHIGNFDNVPFNIINNLFYCLVVLGFINFIGFCILTIDKYLSSEDEDK